MSLLLLVRRLAGADFWYRTCINLQEVSQCIGYTNSDVNSLITGIIWSVWHFPLIISGVYLAKMPLDFQLLLLVVTVTAMTFPISWLRLKSGSVWPAVLFHASHNLYIQRLFDPLTTEISSLSKYMIGESGLVMMVILVGLAVIFWHLRGRLPNQRLVGTQS